MTEPQPIAEDLKNLPNLEQVVLDELVAEFKEQHNEQMNAILIHPEVYKYLTRKSHKKIKRRLYYDVYYWSKTDRVSKYFESAKKVKKYVNHIHNSNLIEDGDCVGMEKTWCYREFTPKHKTYYVSFRPNQFIVVEKY